MAAELPGPRCPLPGDFTVEPDDGAEVPGPTIVVPVFDLPCEAAVEAALAVIPADHPPIEEIVFHYGDYCPPGVYCPVDEWNRGYVVFYASNDGHDTWVQVRGFRGNVRVIADPKPFPPTEDAGTTG
jgi:hypothetical protein